MNFLITKNKDIAINPFRIDEIKVDGNKIIAGIHGSYSGDDMVELGSFENPEITREVFGRLLRTLANINEYSYDGVIDIDYIEKSIFEDTEKAVKVTGKEKLARKEYDTIRKPDTADDLEALLRKPAKKEDAMATEAIRHNIDSFIK